jgi:hypothetical protein
MPHKKNQRAARTHTTSPTDTLPYASSQRTSQTLRSPPGPLPTPPKHKTLPGHTISLHNIPISATQAGVLSLLPNIPITEYKRTPGSSVVFLLLPTLQDAKRVFLGTIRKELMGQEVRAVFVNGVKFENDSSVSAEEKEAEEARERKKKNGS